MSGFSPYKERILKFLNAELAESEFKLSELDKQGQQDKYISAYSTMLKNIIKYIDKNTRTGIFVGLEYDGVDKDRFELAERATRLLDSKEWTKYWIFFLNGRTMKYDLKPTPDCATIYNKKRYQNIVNEETEKSSYLYHKLKVLVEDFNLERFPKEEEKKPENKENPPFISKI